jgi:hypothetical protein
MAGLFMARPAVTRSLISKFGDAALVESWKKWAIAC